MPRNATTGIYTLPAHDPVIEEYRRHTHANTNDDIAAALNDGLIFDTAAATGRLTLETLVAVSASNQLAKTSVFYTPYTGERVSIFNGTKWLTFVFSEITLVLDPDPVHTGFHQSGKNFDLFVANDAGTRRLGTGPAWSSDTARGTGAGTTELERKNGIWTNKVSMSLRWGSASGNTITVTANQGTYVGTMRASANGQCEDSFANRFVWNAYNRVKRAMRVFDATDSWTYSTAAFRQKNGSTANQLQMVRGLNEDSVSAVNQSIASSSTATLRSVRTGIGLDSTTAFAVGSAAAQANVSDTILNTSPSFYEDLPGLGSHFLAALEFGAGTDTQTWAGDSGLPLLLITGIFGSIMA
ncbi:MAG: hypothetical protein ACRDIC_19710 [bacterium]